MLKKMMWTPAAILAASTAATFAGAPTNDHCEHATPITAADTAGGLTLNNAGADTDGESESALINLGGELGHTLWFVYTPSVSGTAYISFCGGDEDVFYDAAFFDACDGNEIAEVFYDYAVDCGDKLGGSINITANQPIVMLVGTLANAGFGVDEGMGAMTITETEVARPDNDACANALPLALGNNTGLNLTDATVQTPTPCSLQTVGDVWFTYTVAATGNVQIGAVYPGSDPVLAVYDGACGSELIACNDNVFSASNNSFVCFSAAAGQQLTIQVATKANHTGPFSVSVAEFPGSFNDSCENAQPVAEGDFAFDNAPACNSGGASCAGSSGGSLWYKYTPGRSGEAIITTFDGMNINSLDTVLSVYDSCNGVQLACGSESTLSNGAHVPPATVAVTVTQNQPVWVRLASQPGTLRGGGTLAIGFDCAADFNGVNGVTVQDIFDFLTAWLAGSASADFNHVNGVTVQDIFDFLTAWLAGC